MKALDLFLFHRMAAGFEPRPWLVAVASAVAVGGPWLGAALLGWVAWRQPSQRGDLVAVLGFAAIAAVGWPIPSRPRLTCRAPSCWA